VRRRYAVALLVFGLSTLAGLYFASQLRWAYPGARFTWAQALTINLIYYWAWGAAVPVVVALARRFPFDAGSRRASAVAHVAASLGLTLLQIAAAASVLWLVYWPMDDKSVGYAIASGVRLNFHSSYPTYWVILFAWLSLDYYGKYRDRELRASQLETRLAEAKLEALRLQLNPHFLFNTLNSISSLMYSDVAAADAMMARLSELLRLSLDAGPSQEVPLRQELELLERYIEIQRIRFEDRLRVTVEVEGGVLDARVPAFSLQPLVENAIRHAIAPRPGGGRLDITARRDDGRLRISLADDGPGLPAEGFREGVGLSNTRARLREIYGSEHSLELAPRGSGGVLVTLSIPYRAA
jgi:sensor histidine kinase YesM